MYFDEPPSDEDLFDTEPHFTVSQFVAACNQSLDYAYGNTQIVGEVANFKINQGKWVFFDLKDEDTSISCFMTLWDLRTELEDGMQVIVSGTPKLTKWGRFSFTVREIMPVGEGNIKKSFEKLKKKLGKEGLFDPAKKRPLPDPLSRIAVISSTQAAGYADFIKILGERWGGLHVQVAHVQVQGLGAADQIIRALDFFNQQGQADIIALIRGGGSADDLAVFNDEALTRAVAASRIPVITGIGHEVDESLCDLAADLRASTPSNVAERLTRDRRAELSQLRSRISQLTSAITARIESAAINKEQLLSIRHQIFSKLDLAEQQIAQSLDKTHQQSVVKITTQLEKVAATQKLLAALDPDAVLAKGYAILSGKISPGELLTITTINNIIQTEVKNVQSRQ